MSIPDPNKPSTLNLYEKLDNSKKFVASVHDDIVELNSNNLKTKIVCSKLEIHNSDGTSSNDVVKHLMILTKLLLLEKYNRELADTEKESVITTLISKLNIVQNRLDYLIPGNKSIIEPPHIIYYKIGNNCVSVFFTQINNTVYTITKYRYTLDNGVSFVEKEENNSSIFISNIINGTQYNVKVASYTQAGWSNLSNEISLTPNDNRSNELKLAISNLDTNNINYLTTQTLADISSVSLYDKIHIINNVAYEISNQTPVLKISVLLSISLRLDINSNSLKSDLNNLMIEAGMEKNIPYIISNQVLIYQIISSDIPFKRPDWNPTTSLSVIIPDNNFLKVDLNQPNTLLLLVPGIEYNIRGIYYGVISSNIYSIFYNRGNTSRTLTINGDDSNKKTIGDNIVFIFPNGYIKFNIDMLGSIGSKKDNLANYTANLTTKKAILDNQLENETANLTREEIEKQQQSDFEETQSYLNQPSGVLSLLIN